MLTHTLGFPRIGRNRELKKAVEQYWRGAIDETALRAAAHDLRLNHWKTQTDNGIDIVPVGDFSYYDHMLDTAVMLGAIPSRYGAAETVDFDLYFRMARGSGGKKPVTALEMTKWFDTNYHYLVPEFTRNQTFSFKDRWLIDEVTEAVNAGFRTKAVLVGPMTFIELGKSREDGFDKWEHLDVVVEVYEEILSSLDGMCEWIQIDEPLLVTALSDDMKARYRGVYDRIADVVSESKLMIATYFEGLGDSLEIALSLPVEALHLDLASDPAQLDTVLKCIPSDLMLSLGVVDGRNVWLSDPDVVLPLIKRAQDEIGNDRLMLAPSCSLLHVPMDMGSETEIDPAIAPWLSFAVQKCRELSLLAEAADSRDDAMLKRQRTVLKNRRQSGRTCDDAVRRRVADVKSADVRRKSPYAERASQQAAYLDLPLLPTTTIGSFPQTDEVRKARRQYRRGFLDENGYNSVIRGYIGDCINRQESLGLDVLVHGEPERTDMVEYFAEYMEGFLVTSNGWVQSYGSRCVKPPVIFGDVSRPEPMTVGWISHAQSLTDKPVKGMLTGPVTILSWSFVRDDIARDDVCRQIALAISDEVCDLEKAGVDIIQIDEPAFREQLPLRNDKREECLRWSVECFRISSSEVDDKTQIHTHMCYSEFNEIIEWIAAMDADVISIEASRSDMELLDSFSAFRYPNEIGPGVYDIHSPRVPGTDEIVTLLKTAAESIDPHRLWVNPDCGLKTRSWEDVMPSLKNMVVAAREARSLLADA